MIFLGGIKNICTGFVQKHKSTVFLLSGIILAAAAVLLFWSLSGNITTVSVTATGDKNPSALSNNVRINAIVLDDGKGGRREMDLALVDIGGGWQYDAANHLLYAYDLGAPAELIISARGAKSVTINFISEVGSGIVRVKTCAGEESIDLYSDTDWKDMPVQYSLFYPALYALYAFCLILLAVGLIMLALWLRGMHIARFSARRVPALLLSGVCLMLTFAVAATAMQDMAYRYIYNKDVVLEIEAAGSKNPSSLGNYVRVRDIYVNDNEYDFSEIELGSGWEYNPIHHLIVSENPDSPQSFFISLKNVRTLRIGFVSEVGSGIVNVYVNGRKHRTLDLYRDTEWDYKYFDYTSSPLIRPHKSPRALALVFAAGVLIGALLYGKKRYSEAVKFAALNYGIAFFICLLAALVQNEGIKAACNWFVLNPWSFWQEFALVSLICTALSLISGRVYISAWLLTLGSVFLLTVNYFKQQFRSSPFLPWDFILASEASSVIDKFELKMSFFVAAVFLCAAALAVLFTVLVRKRLIVFSLAKRLTAFAGVCAVLAFYLVSTYINAGEINMFSINDFYMSEGFINAFVKCTRYLLPFEAPEGYSRQTMEAIAKKIEAAEKDGDKKPNIIVIMSESFWDMERIDKIGFNEELFPTYRKLQKEGVTGRLLTNVFGGGTVNSEFEVITGFSVAFLPDEYMPYQRSMRNGFFSVNSYLKSVGYDSLAIHPFEPTNYNRSNAYECLDFDNALWEKDFPPDADRMRGYISDKALVERIIEEYEEHNKTSDKPWFNFSVSMQNHGGYWGTSIDEGKDVDIDVGAYEETSRDSIRDMAIGLHYADLALGELIDYFKNEDEPALIVMFGDHMSDAGPVGSTLMGQSDMPESDSSVENVYNRHLVPFMAWSNYKDINRRYGTLSVTQLLPTVFEEYDVTSPVYFEYLDDIQDTLPAYASGIAVEPDGSYKAESDMTAEERAVTDELWLIEYDYLFGENYLADIFDD